MQQWVGQLSLSYVTAILRCKQANMLHIYLLFFLHTAAVDRTNCFRVQFTALAWKHREVKHKRYNSRVPFQGYHKGARIYVAINTTLSIAQTNIHCEGVSVTQFLSFILVCHILLCFYLIHTAVPYILLLRKSVT